MTQYRWAVTNTPITGNIRISPAALSFPMSLPAAEVVLSNEGHWHKQRVPRKLRCVEPVLFSLNQKQLCGRATRRLANQINPPVPQQLDPPPPGASPPVHPSNAEGADAAVIEVTSRLALAEEGMSHKGHEAIADNRESCAGVQMCAAESTQWFHPVYTTCEEAEYIIVGFAYMSRPRFAK